MISLSSASISSLTPQNKAELNKIMEVVRYRWTLNARPAQSIPEGDWTIWLLKAGRGFGKTRVGAETVRIWKENNPIIHIVGPTAGDARDVLIEGPAGILECSPAWDKPKYEPSKRRLSWNNGAYALIFSADEPDRLRGPQCYAAWCDELAAWKYPEDAWDNLMMGLRLGSNPRCVVTTTPRPIKLVKQLVKDPSVYVTNGSTYDNIDNLAPAFLNTILKKYEGTRLGRQELNAEILEDVEGALWNLSMIEKSRVKQMPTELVRCAVAIDPSVTSTEDADETGIITGGKDAKGHIYIWADDSGIYSPQGWATKAISSYDRNRADRVIGETNNGGDLIETVIRNIDPSVSYKGVWASRGKIVRAEPVVALYEQQRVHHVGTLAKLEDEMTNWIQGEKSPGRIDALVWLVTFLMDNEQGEVYFV